MFSQNILLTRNNILKYLETNFTNWTSGNEKINNFIQKRQLGIIVNDADVVLEWIPYNQFNEIKEIGGNGLITVYSAIWKDGPLYEKIDMWSESYTRDSNKEVALKYYHNSQESIDYLINEAKKYPAKYESFQVLHGISQNPDTNDYILVLNISINVTNWISGDEKIDDYILERQLKINNYDDIVLEWVPYNQFNEIKMIGKNGLITVYSAIWKDGPLYKEDIWSNYIKDSNKKVALRCLHNSQTSIVSLINEAKKYPTKYRAFQVLYGISQNPDTNDYIFVQNNYTWKSGNEKIDNFIQERQLKINNYDDIMFEWIPYSQFNEIKETGKNGLITVYSAIWKDGPLCFNKQYENYTRDSNIKVTLKCLYNSQESIDSLINESKKYQIKHKTFQVLYGISQNPITNDYIFVQNNYTWINGNEKIDDFIQERQLKINNDNDLIFEWIPYSQFNEIKETGKNGLITVYSAIWKDGPLYKEDIWSNYIRDSNKEVALKYLHNSQESIDSLINEAKKYPIKYKLFQVLYGISQNPDTGNYILVLTWASGNEKIDDFIRKMQLKINNNDNLILEWVPYSQFNEIKEIGKNDLITVYLAIWKDGPLNCSKLHHKYARESNKGVALICLHNSQKSIDYLINEAKKYPTRHKAFQVLYGISQNPDTGDYIFIQNNYIWTSGNEKIDNFIREKQLKTNNNNDLVFEWIPYSQFNEIKKTGKNDQITVYSAIWKDGPLCKKSIWSNNYSRDSSKEVALKCLYNSQEPIDSLINEVEKYLIKRNAFQVLYGISQNPNTKDYILVLIWASGNEIIDDFIQESQLKINNYNDIVFEWIPYNQFNEIKETCKNGFITVYSAIWKNGPLCKMDRLSNNYTRDSNKEVALKYLQNLQESVDSLINEAKKYPTKHNALQVLYGISQNPDTEDYILVLIWTSGNGKIDDFIQERQLKTKNYYDIVLEWIPYNQFNEIKETGKNSLITVYSAIWKDGPKYKNNRWSNYMRDSNKKVALKCLHNSQESIDSLINEAKKYPTTHIAFQVLYGISQNSNTGDYILVLIWTSGNEKIDDFIQERQLKTKNYSDIVIEWIPYNQFNEIEETGKNGLITVYSAIWKDGPKYKKDRWSNYMRDSNKKVALNTEKYLIKHNALQALYGISQNPDTGNYILVLIWTSGSEKIDDFIQERQLKVYNDNDIVFEWIPYNQFNEIEETGKNGCITVYSAIWKDGPFHYNNWTKKYDKFESNSNKKVALKYLYNSKEFIDVLINEAKKYPTKHNAFQALYGISQNLVTGNYILVQKDFINFANWTSKNEKIDDFIQERQLKVNNYNDIVFEWIPYNQFNEVEETGKNSLITVYSAIWKDGPYWHDDENYTRISNKKVALKCLHNSQESIDSFINEAKKYPTKYNELQALYGISQNPDTGDYILILIWTSGNGKIDDFILESQLNINDYNNMVLEWIPYNQFNEIEEIGKNGLTIAYSAIWKDGPLYKEDIWSNYIRDSNKEVALKYLHNSQESVDSLINETKKYLTKYKAFQILNGISQNPDTGDYIFVQNNYIWTSGNKKIDDLIYEMQLKMNDHSDVVFEWIPYNQFNNIKKIGNGGFAIVYSANWKNGPLEYYTNKSIYKRNPNIMVALKCLHNSQNISNKFLNEVKKYSINKRSNILNVYGISQNPDSKEYIMVLQYAKEGNFNHWINKNYKYFIWRDKLSALLNIINGLKEIHQKSIVHRDFHTGNILFLSNIYNFGNCISVSDMGLCGEVGNMDETKIYGVMPYVAPEVLRKKLYTQESDIYSFGMIMYFVATGRQPFYDRAHDHQLALDICKGVRPEICEPEAPRCYIDLMNKCWDLNPNNRPNVLEILGISTDINKMFSKFEYMCNYKRVKFECEIEKTA
ncbi:kinase-like domain-containing protein [Rhizophagus irregularis DAOM 181602=DAOM 197198]|nr:kinase-like domain-containing protein [Rhizophagus irregularis DAOM 181602=DAOM 197198]